MKNKLHQWAIGNLTKWYRNVRKDKSTEWSQVYGKDQSDQAIMNLLSEVNQKYKEISKDKDFQKVQKVIWG